jgi:hypothetical protein
MKQSVALPVKVPEPVLHLHFVSRSDCWSHRPGELLTRLATRLCCRSIRLESCNHPTFRIRTIDRNRLVKHRVDGRDVDYGQRQLVGVSSAPVSGPAPEDESETARRVRIFLENRHTRRSSEAMESSFAKSWIAKSFMVIKDSIALTRKRESRLRKALWFPAASLSFSKEVVGIHVLLTRSLFGDGILRGLSFASASGH